MARYRVKPGDSYLTIAKAHGLNPQQVAQYNPGVSRLSAGMGIKIPQLGGFGAGVGAPVQQRVGGRGGDPLQPLPSGVVRTGDTRRAYSTTNGTFRMSPNAVYTPGPTAQPSIWQNIINVLQGGEMGGPAQPSGVTAVQGSLLPGEGGGHNASPYLAPNQRGGFTGTAGGVVAYPEAGTTPLPTPPTERNPGGGLRAPQVYPQVSKAQGDESSLYQSGFASPSTTSHGNGEGGLGSGYDISTNTAYSLSQGQPVSYSAFLAMGGTPEQAALMGGLILPDQPQAQSQNTQAPGTRQRTPNGGTTIQGENGQYAYISPYAHGQHWRTTTYKDENGNWVKATVPDYGGTRRNYRRGSAHNQGGGGSGITGFGLVNFTVGAG
jgi:LysM repeat protein